MTATLSGILEPLKTAPPDVSAGYAQDLVLKHYGLVARATQLISERDQNFHLKSDCGEEFVLKFANPAECQEVAAFQTQALNHIAAVSPLLPVPRVIKTLDGQFNVLLKTPGDEEEVVVRVLSYLKGEPLYKVPRTRTQRFHIGKISAQLSLALHNFRHPAASHKILWDIQNASYLRDLLVHIPDANDRSLADRFLGNFEEHVLPALPELRSQVVHNDLNPHNLLVDPLQTDRVAGVLDFGDMVHTALINDVAVTASYLLSLSGNPLEPVVEMIAGYHSVCALAPAEINLLTDLIATRYVMNVAITGWRAARYPDNSAYILRNNGAAWAGLRCLDASRRDELQAYLYQACYGNEQEKTWIKQA